MPFQCDTTCRVLYAKDLTRVDKAQPEAKIGAADTLSRQVPLRRIARAMARQKGMP
jgi:hypothetical protein